MKNRKSNSAKKKTRGELLKSSKKANAKPVPKSSQEQQETEIVFLPNYKCRKK